MNNILIRNTKGVALIVVLLIVLAVTAIALVSLNTTRNDVKISTAYTYNRQAAQAAHIAGFYVYAHADDDILTTTAKANYNGIQNAMTTIHDQGNNVTNAAIAEAVSQAESGTKWFNTATDIANIKNFSGMAATPPTSDETRFQGDLSKPTKLTGSVGAPTLAPKTVAGFSDGDAFCSFTMHADAYALVGRAVPVRGSGDNQYYLLSDLNARISGFKREMGLLDVTPLPCHQ